VEAPPSREGGGYGNKKGNQKWSGGGFVRVYRRKLKEKELLGEEVRYDSGRKKKKNRRRNHQAYCRKPPAKEKN